MNLPYLFLRNRFKERPELPPGPHRARLRYILDGPRDTLNLLFDFRFQERLWRASKVISNDHDDPEKLSLILACNEARYTDRRFPISKLMHKNILIRVEPILDKKRHRWTLMVISWEKYYPGWIKRRNEARKKRLKLLESATHVNLDRK